MKENLCGNGLCWRKYCYISAGCCSLRGCPCTWGWVTWCIIDLTAEKLYLQLLRNRLTSAPGDGQNEVPNLISALLEANIDSKARLFCSCLNSHANKYSRFTCVKGHSTFTSSTWKVYLNRLKSYLKPSVYSSIVSGRNRGRVLELFAFTEFGRTQKICRKLAFLYFAH